MNANFTIRPELARSGATITLDGSSSTGQRVDRWLWQQVSPDEPRAEIPSEGKVVTFAAPVVSQRTTFNVRLTINGFGSSPPVTETSRTRSFDVVPDPSPGDSGSP